MNEFRIPDAPGTLIFLTPSEYRDDFGLEMVSPPAGAPEPAFRFFEQPADPWDDDTRASAMLAYAVAYAEAGWPIFPCCAPQADDPTRCRHHPSGCGGDSVGKIPLTRNGFKDATTDSNTVRRWWRQWPAANIGLSCGAAGLFVIDADIPKPTKNADGTVMVDADGSPVLSADGRLVAQKFYEDLGEPVVGVLATMLRGQTASGGRHWFWRLPPDLVAAGWAVRSRNGMLESVDSKAVGGYVVLPPSLHRVGRHYCWDIHSWYPAEPDGELGWPHESRWRIDGSLVDVTAPDLPEVAPMALVDALRDLGLLVNTAEDARRRAEQAAAAAATPREPVVIDGDAVDAALDEILDRVLPLGEGTAWQSWEPVNPTDPRDEWAWVNHAGRNEFLFRQVACRAWRVLAPLAATDEAGRPLDEAAAALAVKVLDEVLAEANRKLAAPLSDDDLDKISASARRPEYKPAPLPPRRLIAGGRVVEPAPRPAPRLVHDGRPTPPPAAARAAGRPQTSPAAARRRTKPTATERVSGDKVRGGRR